MPKLVLETAQKMVAGSVAHGREKKLKLLAVAVLDERGALKNFSAEDGMSPKRGEVFIGKAAAAPACGMGTRSIDKMAKERPYFINSVTAAIYGGPQKPGYSVSTRSIRRLPYLILKPSPAERHLAIRLETDT